MTTSETAIIILAAGKGTRMKSAMPKVLHKVCGKPMINHVIDTAKALSPKKIVTVLSRDTQVIEDSIKDSSLCVLQKQQLGTGDAVKPALSQLTSFKGNIVILYADTPLIEVTTLNKMIKKLDKSGAVVLGFRPDDPAEYGRLEINNSNNLERIVEFKDASPEQRKNNLCNSGVIAIKSDVIQKLIGKITNENANGEYYLTDLIELAKNDGNICSYIEGEEDEVLGVNNRVQLSEAENIFQNRLREKAMLGGATLIDPSSVYFYHDTKVGKDVLIHPNVTFGEGVSVADNVEIKSFSHIEGAKISSGAAIGPFARLRPGTDVGQDARIGNFVEVKKSQIGKGVKIGHLSYIGDSEIGSETNIGAGTITCNYDGVNKFKTKLGKNVFVGSNSALVAPINIGDNSFIGAGSTITKDVGKNSLAVARGRQITKENWKKNNDA